MNHVLTTQPFFSLFSQTVLRGKDGLAMQPSHVTQPHSLPLFPPLSSLSPSLPFSLPSLASLPLFPLSLPFSLPSLASLPLFPLSSLSRFPPSLPSLPPFLSSLSRFPPSLPSLPLFPLSLSLSLFPLSLPSLSSLSPFLSLFPLSSLPSLSSLSPSLSLFPLSLPSSLPSLPPAGNAVRGGLGKGAIPAAAAVNWVLKESKVTLSQFKPGTIRLSSLSSRFLFPSSPLQAMLYAVGLGRAPSQQQPRSTGSTAAQGMVLARAEAQGMVSKTLGMALEAQGMVSKTLGMALGIAIAPHVGTRGHLLWLIHACPAVRPTHVIVLHFLLLPFLSPQVLARAEAQGMVSKTLGMALGIAIAPHVLARAEAQGMVSKTLGMALGIVVAPHVGTRGPLLWATHGLLSAAHLFCNYRSYKAVQLRTLNPFRADIVLAEYVTNGRVPGVIEASPPPLPGTGSENWIEFGVPLASRQQWLTQTDVSTLPYSHSTRTPSPPPLSRPLPLLVQAQAASPPPLPGTGSENWIEFGVPLAAVAHTEREAETMADIFRGEKYLLGRDERTGQMQVVLGVSRRRTEEVSKEIPLLKSTMQVVLKEGALPRDFLRAALQAAYLRTLSPHVLCPTIHSLAPQARTHVQARAAEFSSLGKQIKVLHALLFPSHLFLLLSSPCLLTLQPPSMQVVLKEGALPRDFLRAALQAAYLRTLSPHVLCPTIHLSRTPSAHPRPSPRSRIRFLGEAREQMQQMWKVEWLVERGRGGGRGGRLRGRGRLGEGRLGEGRLEEGRLGEGRLGEGRLGEGRLGEGRLGEGRLGEGRLGEGRLGEGRLGEGRLGEGRLGEGRLGEGRLGEGRLGRGD
ncbi:unnamed protein product [Closterium sp. NIES-64]|nr:unnamed protein product [Closterium sp. NIES-64]